MSLAAGARKYGNKIKRNTQLDGIARRLRSRYPSVHGPIPVCLVSLWYAVSLAERFMWGELLGKRLNTSCVYLTVRIKKLYTSGPVVWLMFKGRFECFKGYSEIVEFHRDLSPSQS